MKKKYLRLIASIFILSLILGLSVVANAGKDDDTIRWCTLRGAPYNIDMYYGSERPGIIIAHHIWDTLVEKDLKTGEYIPSLAKSWRRIDDLTIEFDLRDDVVFHNGEKFDADDVVYTFDFMSNPKNKCNNMYVTKWFALTEKIGPYKIRIKTKKPFPPMMEYICRAMWIYPNEYYSKVGPEGMSKKPIGTGPYKVTKLEYGGEIILVKNEQYMKNGPKTPSVGRLIYSEIREVSTQIAELISGGLDWIWKVPRDMAENLKGRDGIKILEGESMRINLLIWDVQGKTNPNIATTKLKVRQAMIHAVDRETIAKKLVGPSSRVIHAICYPKQFGCDIKGVKRYEYNPEKAKKLLVEAGYPNGFEIDFYTSIQKRVVESIISYFNDVGIKAKLKMSSGGAMRKMRRTKGMPLQLGTIGSRSVGDVSAAFDRYHNCSSDDQCQNKKIKALLDEVNQIVDPEKRKEKYNKILQIASETLCTMPLFTNSYYYAINSDLEWTPPDDEIIRFWEFKWK